MIWLIEQKQFVDAANALKILKDMVKASYQRNAMKCSQKDGTPEKEELKV